MATAKIYTAKPGIQKGTPAPDWAMKIAAKACTLPELFIRWTVGQKNGTRHYVSGVSDNIFMERYIVDGAGKIRRAHKCIGIKAGADTGQTKQLWVLLHEIAHANVGNKHQHDAVWQKEAVRLYRRFGILTWLAENHTKVNMYACEKKAVLAAYNRSAAAKKATTVEEAPVAEAPKPTQPSKKLTKKKATAQAVNDRLAELAAKPTAKEYRRLADSDRKLMVAHAKSLLVEAGCDQNVRVALTVKSTAEGVADGPLDGWKHTPMNGELAIRVHNFVGKQRHFQGMFTAGFENGKLKYVA